LKAERDLLHCPRTFVNVSNDDIRQPDLANGVASDDHNADEAESTCLVITIVLPPFADPPLDPSHGNTGPV
jgi:hypothetical protein